MKIGLFSDSHVSDLLFSCETRRPHLSFEKIREAMRTFQMNEVELVVCLGDLLDHCMNPLDEQQILINISGMINSFKIPFYCIRGNHDCQNFRELDFYRIGNFQIPPFAKKTGDCSLIFLNTCFHEDGTPYLPEKTDWKNSWLPEEQMIDLKRTLADPTVKEAVIFLHQLLNPSADVRFLVRNAAEIREILEKSQKVHHVYSGHYHLGLQETVNSISYHAIGAMCEGTTNRFEIIEI